MNDQKKKAWEKYKMLLGDSVQWDGTQEHAFLSSWDAALKHADHRCPCIHNSGLRCMFWLNHKGECSYDVHVILHKERLREGEKERV